MFATFFTKRLVNSCEESGQESKTAVEEECWVEPPSNRAHVSSDNLKNLTDFAPVDCEAFDPDTGEFQVPVEIEGIDVLDLGYFEQQQATEGNKSIDKLSKAFVSKVLISADSAIDEVHRDKGCNKLEVQRSEGAKGSLEILNCVPAEHARFTNETEGCQPQNSEVVSSSRSYAVCPSKPKSALRGGGEKSGLGQRPKLHVTWAPDVYDPICSSSSHTVPQNFRRHQSKSNCKSSHKAKANRGNSSKKAEKKSRKSRHAGERCVLRTPADPSLKGRHGGSLYHVGLTDALHPSFDIQALKPVLPVLPQKPYYVTPVVPLQDQKLVTLNGRMPLSWHVQTHRLCL